MDIFGPDTRTTNKLNELIVSHNALCAAIAALSDALIRAGLVTDQELLRRIAQHETRLDQTTAQKRDWQDDE